MREILVGGYGGVFQTYHKYKVASINCNVGKDNADSIAMRYGKLGFQAVRELNGNIQLVEEDNRFGWIFYYSFLVEYLNSGFYRSIDCETRYIQSS